MDFLLLLFILVRKVVTQGTAVPETTFSFNSLVTAAPTVPSTGIEFCSACYGVAQIDQIITGVGVSYYVQLGQFTWNLAEVFNVKTGGPSLVALPTASEITFSDFPVNNPTMYNVFTTYQVVALYEPSGKCIPTTLEGEELAFPVTMEIPSGASSNIITQAESVFVDQLGKINCTTITLLGGGVVVSSTVAMATTTAIPSNITEIGTSISGQTTISPKPSASIKTITLTLDASVTSLLTNDTGQTTLTASTSNGTNTNSAMPGDGFGLSQSVKIGLGVGLGLGGAFIFLFVGVLIWNHKHKGRRIVKQSDAMAEMSSTEPEVEAELPYNDRPYELSIDPRPELASDSLPQSHKT